MSISHKKHTRQMLAGKSINFDDEDENGMTISHYSTLLITFQIFGTDIRRVLIDPSSSANKVQLRAIEEMELMGQAISKLHLLYRFNSSSEMTRCEVTLTTNVEEVVNGTHFHVVAGDMTYNSIQGRPWIHKMDAVPSTLHQVFKFPSK
ncbi:uncharacterized protein LOC142164055 [Nicotiana tabacum]|uniref:Uncharacterized protein LOC142164055 n=1 Tax=Nicotiana tabacum TaxID=4097 RepID=A0AC58RX65_TOBAC